MKNMAIVSKEQVVALIILIAITVFASFTRVVGQDVYSVDPSSKMTIAGTSTIHDWESAVTKMKGSAEIDLKSGKIASIDKLQVSIPVSSIKSGKSGMDKNTYNALKESDHPEIKFQLRSVKSLPSGQLTAQGHLTIAGVTKAVEIPVKYAVKSPEKIQFQGSISFKMSEFKVDPPTAMMGTVRSGDEVTLNFDTLFTKGQSSLSSK